MGYSVKTGKPAFENIFGKPYFDYLQANPELAASFDKGMKNISQEEEKRLVTFFDVPTGSTIIDIGGGYGGFLTQILQRKQGLKVLFLTCHICVSMLKRLCRQLIAILILAFRAEAFLMQRYLLLIYISSNVFCMTGTMKIVSRF
jgi:hypothetical protein